MKSLQLDLVLHVQVTRILTSIEKCHVTHRPSCPHGTTSNKAFTLVWNRGVKRQSSQMDFIPFLSDELRPRMVLSTAHPALA